MAAWIEQRMLGLSEAECQRGRLSLQPPHIPITGCACTACAGDSGGEDEGDLSPLEEAFDNTGSAGADTCGSLWVSGNTPPPCRKQLLVTAELRLQRAHLLLNYSELCLTNTSALQQLAQDTADLIHVFWTPRDGTGGGGLQRRNSVGSRRVIEAGAGCFAAIGRAV